MFEEVTVGESSRLAGTTLAESDIRSRYNVIVIAIKKTSGEMVFNPGPAAELQGGDTLITLGDRDQLQQLQATV